MKILTPLTVRAAFGELPAAPVTDDNTNWHQEYNRLRSGMLKLQQTLSALQNPARNEQATQRDLAAVAAFISSMGKSEGAVACAAIYNAAWFTADCDTMYATALSRTLITAYADCEGLIETTYTMWSELSAKTI